MRLNAVVRSIAPKRRAREGRETVDARDGVRGIENKGAGGRRAGAVERDGGGGETAGEG